MAEPISINEDDRAAEEYLAIVGTKTEKNELEDFWMAKISHLESQYDEHLRILQLKLFDHRADRKNVVKLREDNRYLQHTLDSSQKKKKELSQQLKKLDEKHKIKEREVTTVKQKLGTTLQLKANLNVQLNQRSKELRDSEKKQRALSRKLSNMEADRKDVTKSLEGLQSRFKDVETNLKQDEKVKKQFAYTLGQIDTERRVQTQGNFRLLDKISDLVSVVGTKEEQLYAMQTEINQVMRSLQQEQNNERRLLRAQQISQKQIQQAQDELTATRAKAELEERQSRHWREELEFQKMQTSKNDYKDESILYRSQLAQIKQRLRKIEQNVKFYDSERTKLSRQLEILPTLQKSLEQLLASNKKKRKTLTSQFPKISISSPAGSEEALDPFSYFANLEEKKRAEEAANRPRIHLPRNSTPTTIQYPNTLSYDKEINKLSKQMQQLDSKLKESRRKENVLRFQLENTKQLKQELFWREKAMMAIEKDKASMDKLLTKTAQELGDRFGSRRLPMNLLFGPEAEEISYQQQQMKQNLLKQMKSQQEKLESLKRESASSSTSDAGSSLPKLTGLQRELERLHVKELLGLEPGQLQEKINDLKTETENLETRHELVKKLRPPTPPIPTIAASTRKSSEERDVIDDHFVPEEELLATISKQFSDPNKFEQVVKRSQSSSSSSGPSESGSVASDKDSSSEGVQRQESFSSEEQRTIDLERKLSSVSNLSHDDKNQLLPQNEQHENNSTTQHSS